MPETTLNHQNPGENPIRVTDVEKIFSDTGVIADFTITINVFRNSWLHGLFQQRAEKYVKE